VINADDEFAALWRGMTRAPRDDLRRAQARGFLARDMHTAIDAQRLRHALHAAAPQGAMPIELHLAGATTC
jgi:hypothetical protein